MQAGYPSYSKEKHYKYILVRDFVVDAMIASKCSPTPPPVPTRRREVPLEDMSTDTSDDEDSDFKLGAGYETPKPECPKKRLYFPTPTSGEDDSAQTKKLALFKSLSAEWVASDPIFANSPGDSLLAQKGSPLMEEIGDEFNELFDFKDADQALIAEAEEAESRLLEATQTLADLKSCDKESAANALATLMGQPDQDEVNRRLRLHIAEQQKRLAEAEAAVKKHLAASR